jgi:hypothetical protein
MAMKFNFVLMAALMGQAVGAASAQDFNATALLRAAQDGARAMANQSGAPPATPLSNAFDEAAFLDDLARALGETNVVRAPWAMDDISQPQGMILTAAQAQELADRLRADRKFPFNYIYNGCEARAHVVCDVLHKQGIASAKIFADGIFLAHGEAMYAGWGVHVAPLIYVRDEATGKVGVRVLDLSLAHKPLQVAEWIGLFRVNSTEITVDLVHDTQFGPRKQGEKEVTFESNLPDAYNSVEAQALSLEKEWLAGPDNTESAAIGPVSRKMADALQKSLNEDQAFKGQSWKDPVVTEVLGKPEDGRLYGKDGDPYGKVKVTYTFSSPEIAEIADKIIGDSDSSECETILADNVAWPEGMQRVTSRVYGSKVIFEMWWSCPQN